MGYRSGWFENGKGPETRIKSGHRFGAKPKPAPPIKMVDPYPTHPGTGFILKS